MIPQLPAINPHVRGDLSALRGQQISLKAKMPALPFSGVIALSDEEYNDLFPPIQFVRGIDYERIPAPHVAADALERGRK